MAWYEITMAVQPHDEATMPTIPRDWLLWFIGPERKVVDDLHVKRVTADGRMYLPPPPPWQPTPNDN